MNYNNNNNSNNNNNNKFVDLVAQLHPDTKQKPMSMFVIIMIVFMVMSLGTIAYMQYTCR